MANHYDAHLIADGFDIRADAASQRYNMLLMGWQGAYLQAIDASPSFKPSVLGDLLGTAAQLARTYQETEHNEIGAATESVSLDAHQRATQALGSGVPHEYWDAITERLIAARSDLSSELQAQTARDLRQLHKSYYQAMLDIHMVARSQGISRATARIQQRGRHSSVPFMFRDRAGRRWSSPTFARTVWRQHLVNTFNSSTLEALSAAGERAGQVYHEDPAKSGQRIQIGAYNDVADELFHPNARGVLGAISQ